MGHPTVDQLRNFSNKKIGTEICTRYKAYNVFIPNILQNNIRNPMKLEKY